MARFTRVFVAALVTSLATAAVATTVVVPPGPGTPVQDAIDAAAPGDTIRLTLGTYPENLVIGKALKLRGVRSRSTDVNATTILTGACGGGSRVTITADSVQVRGILIIGATGGAVQVVGRDRVKLIDLFATAHCPTPTAPTFDVVQSTRVTMKQLWAVGVNQNPVPQPGIRIADTPQGGRVRVQNSISGGFQTGVLLENDGILSTRVSASYVNFNERGIVLQGTSRAIVDHNRQIIDNTTSGIDLDATSSGNAIVGNSISGSITDVVDAGTGNCWRNNVYTTGSVPACP